MVRYCGHYGRYFVLDVPDDGRYHAVCDVDYFVDFMHLLWFKFIKPLSTDKTKAGLSREATIGQIGMVIQASPENEHIRVRFPIPVLGSDEWNCRTLDKVHVGDRVRVVEILGNDLMVKAHLSTNENR